jgi:adenylate kinase
LIDTANSSGVVPVSPEFWRLVEVVRPWLGTGSINIFGLPAAGKDEQGRALSGLLGAVLLQPGVFMRLPGWLSDSATESMNQGLLLRPEEAIELFTRLFREFTDPDKPFVLTSMGRHDGEQQSVMAAASEAGHPVRVVVLLSVTVAEAKRRQLLEVGRADREIRADRDPSIIDTRFNEFRVHTRPVIDFYRQEGILLEVDGTGTIEEVTLRLLQSLANFSVARSLTTATPGMDKPPHA